MEIKKIQTDYIKIIKNTLIISCFIAVISFFIYSFIQYKKTDIEEKGLIVCANENTNTNSDTNSSEKCFWNAHIHTYIPIKICDTSYSLSKFKGPLNKIHAHGDENVIHFHNKIPFDKKTNKFLETPLKLKNIFKDLELPFSTNSLLGKKDGELCGNVIANWKFFVNGVSQSDWENYEWKDRDIIFFVFSSQSKENIEQEINNNPLKFPSFGTE